MDILELLRDWRSKGELCYLGKGSGLSWGDIEAECRGGRLLAMRWAKTHGKAWPVKVGVFGARDAEVDSSESSETHIEYGDNFEHE